MLSKRLAFILSCFFIFSTTVCAADNANLSFLSLLLMDKTSSVGTVVSASGRVWMDRNLGASRVATSIDDEQAYGDLYQWGRGADGHEKRTSGTTMTLSGSDSPGHGNFIIATNFPYDWSSPQNDNLWQGASGVNNPCPAGFRLPTEAEWEIERLSWGSKDSAGAYNSPLKLVPAGYRHRDNGTLHFAGSRGLYWSGTVNDVLIRFLIFSSDYAGMASYNRADGFSVRCIED